MRKTAEGFLSLRAGIAIILCGILLILSFPRELNASYQKKAEEYFSELDIPVTSVYKVFPISNTLQNVFVTLDDGNHKSFIYKKSGGARMDIESIVKQGKLNNFNALILQCLKKKYPKFIVDGVTKGADAAYDINRNFIRVYYSNIQSSPAYGKEIFVTLNAADARGLVTFPMTEAAAVDENTVPLDPALPVIALTFDDGPTKQSDALLNILCENKANATFFIQGKAICDHPDTILRGLEYGNEHGSHTYSHADLVKLGEDKIRYQMDATNNAYEQLTGSSLETMRPPYGNMNDSVLQTLDLPCVLWSVDTKDWSKRNADHLIDYILENASDGDIVLCHDIYTSTVDAMKTILPELYVRGIQVTTVSNLAKLKGKTLEPNVIYKSLR